MHYSHPTFLQEVVNFFRVMISLFWYQTSVQLDESCVLVVMDAIEAYRPLYSQRTLTEICNSLEAARRNKCKIVFTRWIRSRQDDCPETMDEIDRKGHWSFFVPKNGTELLIQPHEGEVVVDVKHTNAFMNPKFSESIDRHSTLVFTGGWAESCITNTVRHAIDRDMRTIVIKNACMGHPGAFQYAMFVLQNVYTRVITKVDSSVI